MTSPSIVIRHARGYIRLWNLSFFFENSVLEQIRRVLKLLKAHAHENKDTIEKLNAFLPLWAADVKERAAAMLEELDKSTRLATRYPQNSQRKKEQRWAEEASKRADAIQKRCNKVIAAYKELKI